MEGKEIVVDEQLFAWNTHPYKRAYSSRVELKRVEPGVDRNI